MYRLFTVAKPSLTAALTLAAAGVWAAAPQPLFDSGQPIHIDASRAEFSQPNKQSTYTGNVILTQGSLVLHGDRLVVTRADNGSVHAVLTGDPARVQRSGTNIEPVHGHAGKITYNSDTNIVELVGDAYMERAGDTVHGASIRHDLNTARTRAESGAGKRVHITITPDTVKPAGGKQAPAAGDNDSKPTNKRERLPAPKHNANPTGADRNAESAPAAGSADTKDHGR